MSPQLDLGGYPTDRKLSSRLLADRGFSLTEVSAAVDSVELNDALTPDLQDIIKREFTQFRDSSRAIKPTKRSLLQLLARLLFTPFVYSTL